jgi:hypothetical protein
MQEEVNYKQGECANREVYVKAESPCEAARVQHKLLRGLASHDLLAICEESTNDGT